MESDPSLRFAAPLILNPPAGTSSNAVVSCQGTGATNCLISLRLLDGIVPVGGVDEPFVAANRLSNEGGPSALPPFFLAFFVDRGESSTSLSRLFDAVLGPASVAFWAPRIAIPDVSVRSARGRVGALNRRGGGVSVIGRAGRECIRVSACDLLAGAPLVFLGLVTAAVEGSAVMLIGASNCPNKRERVVGHKNKNEKAAHCEP